MKKRIFFGVVVVVLLGVGLVIRWALQPSVSMGPNSRQIAAVKGDSVQFKDIETGLFRSKLEDSFRMRQQNEQKNGPIFGQYVFGSKEQNNADQIAVVIGELPSGDLQDASPYKVRSINPEEYTKGPQRSSYPVTVAVFDKTSSFERAVIWKHGTYYVSVVVSGSSAHRSQLYQDVDTFIQNWQWK